MRHVTGDFKCENCGAEAPPDADHPRPMGWGLVVLRFHGGTISGILRWDLCPDCTKKHVPPKMLDEAIDMELLPEDFLE